MHPKHCQYSVLTIAALLLASPVRAQDNPLGDPDLKEMLKQAAEMQKKAGELHKQNPSSHDMRKKLEIKRFRMKLNLWPRIQPQIINLVEYSPNIICLKINGSTLASKNGAVSSTRTSED